VVFADGIPKGQSCAFVGRRSSEERVYKHAMGVLGVCPHETWMVGDNLEWEIVAPQRLGIYAIWHDGYGVGLPANSPNRPDRIIRPSIRIAGLTRTFARRLL
jgi:FMN phosphatase YigB (HAD superfamily)